MRQMRLTRIICHGLSEVGEKMANSVKGNQDYFYAHAEGKSGSQSGIFIIADGMGTRGQVSSRDAVEHISGFLHEHRAFDRGSDLERLMEEAVRGANTRIIAKKSEGDLYFDMGTTLTMAVIRDDILYWSHVGDSRLYTLHSDGMFRQATKDANVVQDALDAGAITDDEAMADRRRSELRHFLGKSPELIGYSKGTLRLVEGDSRVDKIILVSDGIYSLARRNEIEGIARETGAEMIPSMLIALAGNPSDDTLKIYADKFGLKKEEARKKFSGKDNMTCIAAELRYR